MKMDMAMVIAALRPKMSLKRPYRGWKAVDVKRYAEGTHETIDPALKATEMVGMAVAMITVSKVDTTIQSARPRKQAIIFLNGSKFVWSVNSTGACPSFVGVETGVGVAVPEAPNWIDWVSSVGVDIFKDEASNVEELSADPKLYGGPNYVFQSMLEARGNTTRP